MSPLGRMNMVKDICPISDFRVNANSFIKQVRENHRPLVLTQHGKSSAIVIGVEDYEKIQERLEFLEELYEAQEQVRSGKTQTQEEVEKRLKKKFKDI